MIPIILSLIVGALAGFAVGVFLTLHDAAHKDKVRGTGRFDYE